MAASLRIRASKVRRLLILVIAGLAVPAVAQSLEFPAALGPFEHARYIDFELEQSGRGFSHSYFDAGATASLFVYSNEGGATSVEDAEVKAEFETSATELESQLASAGFESIEVVERGRISSIANAHRCLSMLVSYVDGANARITWLCVLPFGEDFLKLRYTVVPGDRNQQREALGQFQSALAQFIDEATKRRALEAEGKAEDRATSDAR